MSKSASVIVAVLVAVGLALVWGLFKKPTPSTPTPSPTTQPSTPPTSHPLITVTSPQPNQVISSPLRVSGQARGPWFFEATFPIELKDQTGLAVGIGYATAQGEWMTEEFVPFTADIEFSREPVGKTGVLIFSKSNASGLPEHDDSFQIPVLFE